MLEDERIFALTADIGFRNFDDIIADMPDRFINVGIAEANMIGVAAGLALSGKIPFVFTIAPFVTLRCLEQIRIDLCYEKLPVKLIGAGGGFVYGPQGTTHHAVEEIGVLRTLPGMTVIAPADPLEVTKTIQASMELKGPVYIRIGRNKEPQVTRESDDFQIGKAAALRQGDDITIFTYGLSVKNAIEASDILADKGIGVKVVNVHTIKPIDSDFIIKCINEAKCIITVEEHNIMGGLGSAVAEILAENIHNPLPFKRLGVNDTFLKEPGDYQELLQELGLDSHGIIREIEQLLSKDLKKSAR
jgi:transketolase